MKPIFPQIENEQQYKIHQSKMLIWVFTPCIFLIYISTQDPLVLKLIQWAIIPCMLMFILIDFVSYLVFKNHVINHDQTALESEELKQMFSIENMKKIKKATDNSYYWETETVSNACSFALLISMNHPIIAIIIGAYYIYDRIVITPFVEDYIR